MSQKGDLEKIKQIFTYVKQENISEEEIRGTLFRSKQDVSNYAPKLLDQMLQCNQIEAVKLPEFLVSEIPAFLCSMSHRGDLEKIKQIFAYVNQENISVEEMEVQNNEVYRGKKPTLVDTHNGTYNGRKTPLILAAARGYYQICEYLITEQKANLEARDNMQRTALFYAFKSSRTAITRTCRRRSHSNKSLTGIQYAHV